MNFEQTTALKAKNDKQPWQVDIRNHTKHAPNQQQIKRHIRDRSWGWREEDDERGRAVLSTSRKAEKRKYLTSVPLTLSVFSLSNH